jgi:hypothetical protein
MVLTLTAGEQGMPENAADYDGPINVIGNPRVIAEAIRQAITAMSVFTEMAAGPAGAA